MRILLYIFIAFSVWGTLHAQNVTIDGVLTDIDNNDKMEGVSIKAIANGATVASTTSQNRGKYTLSFPVGSDYTIEYSKNGYVTKIMKINVSAVSDEDIPIGGKIFPPIDIDLFENRPSVDFSFTKKEPVVAWNWDTKSLQMDWDRDIHKRMKKKIDDLLAEADQKEKENEAKYNQLIAEADGHFDSEEYDQALTKYESAIKIPGREMEQHPNMRIAELDELLQAKAKEELIAQQSGEKYDQLISEAQALREKKEYDKAIDRFYSALDVKPDETYPLDQIDEINILLKEKQIRQEYDKLIEMADNFLNQNSVQAAEEKYKEALELFPDEQYPKDQLEKIQSKLKEAEERQKLKDQYDAAIAAADKHFDAEEWEQARDRYQEAIDIESAATYPKARLDIVNENLAEIDAARMKKVKYDSLVAIGDEALNNSQFDDAILKYDEALSILDEQYAKDQKAKAQEELDKLKNEEAKQAKIEELLASAQTKIEAENFDGAIEDFDAILALDETNQQSIEGKANALKKKEELENLAERQENFNQLVSEADAFFEAEDYAAAKSKYEEANQVIENDDHVVARIDEVGEKLNALASAEEKQAQIDGLMAEAKSFEDAASWSEALTKYEEVLSIEEEYVAAQEGKTRVENKISENKAQEELELAYQNQITKADNLLENSEYANAKQAYEEALQIKQSDEYALSKIDEINKVMEEKAEEIAMLEAYQQAIKTGDEAMENNSFDNAIEAYQSALSIKKGDEDATSKLEKANNLKAQIEEFNALKEEGREFVSNEDWENAQEKFIQAKAINEDEEVQQQLEFIQEQLNQLASAEEKEEQYKELIAKAEEKENADDLAGAIETYKSALKIKENDAFAQSKIDELNDKLSALSQNNENEEAFASAMEKAQVAFESEDYAAAIEAYDDALEIKEDTAAQEGKAKAKAELAKLAAEEEAYQALLAEGKAKREAEELLAAKEIYKKAQEQRPKDPVPQNAIVEIDELLRIKQEKEAAEKENSVQEKLYQEKIAQAEVQTQNFKYEQAIDLYKEASKIKPDEELPRTKVKELRALLDQMAAQTDTGDKYEQKVKEADNAFNNKDYDKSIELYQEALDVKKDEAYPKTQIAKAQAAIDQAMLSQLEDEFQQKMKVANSAFSAANYEEAINGYDEALKIKPSNKEATAKRNEAVQLLEKLKAEELANTENQKKYESAIAEADKLFDEGNYLDSKNKYEEALFYKGNDNYALTRRDEAMALINKAIDTEKDRQYQKIIDKADEYLADENYDKAKNLYNRASSLRNEDQYPKDKLAEIEAILSGSAIVDKSLEYLGEEESISLVEGAALLEQGEKTRQNKRSQRTLERIYANEVNFEEKLLSDNQERINVQIEFEDIKDHSNDGFDDYLGERQELAVELDDEMYQLSQQKQRELTFESSAILRQNEQISFIIDDYNTIHEENDSKHLDNADKLDEVKIAYDELSLSERMHAEDKWVSNDQEITTIAQDLELDTERAAVIRKKNEVEVYEINDFQLESRVMGQEDNYRKVLDLQDDALAAKMAVEDKQTDKMIIQTEIENDLAALEVILSDKSYNETQENADSYLQSDAILIAAMNQYKETTADADDNRQKTVEEIKVIQEDADAQMRGRNDEKTKDIQDNMDEVESIIELNEIARQQVDEEHEKTVTKINQEEDRMTQLRRAQDELDQRMRKETQDEIENTLIAAESSHEVMSKKVLENVDALDALQASDLTMQQMRNESSQDKLLDNQKTIDNEDYSKREKPIIANSLGEEFPEGVTEKTYIKRDKDDVPVQIIVRRIVVIQGKGVEYRRIQTRNGVVYSRDGESITEAIWNRETQSADLVRN
jgi:tetratricopeptide (TPR) repeat protein